MKNFKSPYLGKDEVGKKNAWLFFYDQISDYPLEEVYKSDDVIMQGRLYKDIAGMEKEITNVLYGDKKAIKKWGLLYRKYFHLNENMRKKVRKVYAELFARKNGKILGVKFRSGDYIHCIAHDHFIQPGLDEVCQNIDRILKSHGYGYIYLSSDNIRIREVFQQKYGKKLICSGCKLADYELTDKKGPMADVAAEQVGRVQSGVDYIVDIMLLSKCDALLTSGNSGAIMAIIINGQSGKQYENIWLMDYGKSL